MCPLLQARLDYYYETGGDCCSCGTHVISIEAVNNDLVSIPTGYVVLDGVQHDFNLSDPLTHGISLDYNFYAFNRMDVVVNYNSCRYTTTIFNNQLPFLVLSDYHRGTEADPCYETFLANPSDDTRKAFLKQLKTDILGCTDKTSPNYNASATIDDGSCSAAISGCTDPNSFNYNPNATVSDGSCRSKIYGCMNPLYNEYNVNANIDDGSCKTLKSIKGCSNPMAVNYNPNATANDGSCIFVSGCTNSAAVNFNPLAVIDDGACKCGDVVLEISQAFSLDACDYTFSFDYRININCEDILEYYLSHSLSILDILSKISLYIQVKNNRASYRQIIYSFNKTDLINGLVQNIIFSGDADKCALLKEFITIELKKDCNYNIGDLISNQWTTYVLPILSDYNNSAISISYVFPSMDFPIMLELDEIKLSKVCNTVISKTYIRPNNIGFEKERIIDNKKTTAGADPLIKNTKEIDLKFDPSNLIETDYVDYFKANNELLPLIYRGYLRPDAYLNPSNFLTNSQIWIYSRLKSLYYTSIYNYCNALSKKLDYYYHLQISKMIDKNWYNFMDNFIPATSIRNSHTKLFRNTVYDEQKFVYKKYNVYYGTDSLITPPNTTQIVFSDDTIVNCGVVIDVNEIDKRLKNIHVCPAILQNVTYTMYNDTPYGSGRYLIYNKLTNAIINSGLDRKTNFQPC